MASSFVRRWALVAATGVILAIKEVAHELPHPFHDIPAEHRAVDVSGVPAEVGFHVDAMGNVASLPPGVTLAPNEAAYHDRSHLAYAEPAPVKADEPVEHEDKGDEE